MAPIKFEENIKDRLEKRTLSPSPESWSKLSDRLDAEQKKSKNSMFWWLSIAAGLFIMVAISIQFFNNGESNELMPTIANEEIKEEQIENKTPKLDELKVNELAVESDVIKDEKYNSQSTEKSQTLDYKKSINKNQKSKAQLAENSSVSPKAIKTNKALVLKENLPIITNKVIIENAVVDVLKDLKSENTTVTDREIDSLLKAASKELFKDKLQKNTSKTVDANALLLSVEEDMGQSFRSKVFDALKESYETVKTAVAERNN